MRIRGHTHRRISLLLNKSVRPGYAGHPGSHASRVTHSSPLSSLLMRTSLRYSSSTLSTFNPTIPASCASLELLRNITALLHRATVLRIIPILCVLAYCHSARAHHHRAPPHRHGSPAHCHSIQAHYHSTAAQCHRTPAQNYTTILSAAHDPVLMRIITGILRIAKLLLHISTVFLHRIHVPLRIIIVHMCTVIVPLPQCIATILLPPPKGPHLLINQQPHQYVARHQVSCLVLLNSHLITMVF